MALSRRFPVVLVRLVLPVAFAASLGAQPADLQVRQLSPEGSAFTDVKNFLYTELSPDGKWIVFFADADTDNVEDLYSVPRFGGAPRRLSASRPPGADAALPGMRLTPDSRRVIFWLDQETLGRRELWSVPIEGPAAAAVKLSPSSPLDAEVITSPFLSSDGLYAAFLFDGSAGLPKLWSAPTDGSGPAFALHADFPAGATGLSETAYSGSRVLFLADLATAGRTELWSAPLDGSTPAVRLNGALIAAGDVDSIRISLDGQRVLYFADQRVDGQIELYSVPIAGPFSAAERLSPTLPALGDITLAADFEDSSRVLFLADSSLDEQFELWSVPIAGPATAAVKLNGPLVAGGDVLNAFSAAAGQAIYTADAAIDEVFEAYLVPVDGPSQAGFRVNDDPPAGGDVTFGGIVDFDAEPFLILVGDLRVDGRSEIFTAPMDDTSAPRPLFANPPAGQGYLPSCGAGFTTDPTTIVFCADAGVAGVVRAYRTLLNPISDAVLLSTGSALAASDVSDLEVDSTGRWAAYRYDPGTDEAFELWRARVDGSGTPHRVHALPIPAGADLPTNGSAFTPDGEGLVYLADHDVDEKLELWISDGYVFRGDFEWGTTAEWSSVAP